MKGNDKHQQHPAVAGKKKRFSWRQFLGFQATPRDPHGVDRFSTQQYLRLTGRMARLALLSFWRRHRLASRLFAILLVGLLIFQIVSQIVESRRVIVSYEIPESAQKLLPRPIQQFEPLIKAKESGGLIYNEGYKLGSNYAGDSSTPQLSADFTSGIQPTASFTDPVTSQTVGFKAKYGVEVPKKDVNRVVYPLKGKQGMKVYSLGVTTVKEDIILLERPAKDTLELAYELQLGQGMEARLEADGSLCVYGISSALGSGSITTGSEADAELLQKAQQNAPKNRLIFRFPAPYVLEGQKKMSKVAKSWFELKDGKNLILHTKGLHQATYPLSIDPTVYIETARKLMRGNNESNIDFDVANELIQKSQTTGARIDEWSGTTNLTSAVWGQGTAAAGGFIYSAGGVGSGNTVTSTYNTAGSTTYNVPAGVTNVTIEAWGGGGGGGGGSGGAGLGGNGGGGGYAKAVISVTPSESLNVDVGTGGAKAGANGRGGNGGGFSAVRRSGTYLVQAAGGGGGSGRRGSNAGTIGHGGAGGGATGEAGTAGATGGSGGGGTSSTGGSFGNGTGDGVAGAANAGGNAGTTTNCSTNATGTGGAGGTGGGGSGGTYATTCAAGGGGGGGRYGGGGGGSTSTNNRTGGGGGGGSSYVNPVGLVSGTDQLNVGSGQTPGNSGDSDRGGLADGGSGATTAASATAGDNGIVLISYTTPGSVSSSVYWAQFNTNTNAIESPNPGNGVCSGWCTNSAYDLPDERQGLSLVSYNGFLYAIGGTDSAGAYQSTVYIAKLGANGEPQLWHPSGGTPVYWYTDTALSNARSQFGATVYKNKVYILGGLTTGSSVLSSNTVQQASINPTGTLTSWTTTGTQALGTARYGLTAQVYNDVLYVIGGNASLGGSPVTTVEYSKLTSSGDMNTWVATSSLLGGRATLGGSFSTIFGGYLYLAGGCQAVNASGYCTTIATDVQLASLNADGSVAPWNSILNLSNDRFGHTLIAWQGGLYRMGGCRAQDSGSGACSNTVLDVDYGVINQDGDASTVSNSEPSGTSPCSGANPKNCDMPPAGDSAGQGGQMSSMVVINNGYIYNIGGCVSGGSACNSNMSGNVSYASITSTGDLASPPNCSGTSYGLWCVDSTNRINGTNGIGAAAAVVFNDTIYVAGGTDSSSWQANIYRVGLNTDGSLSGAWQSQTFNSVGMASSRSTGDDARGYMYMFARSNPSSAGTNPGNLYILGGCSGSSGIGCSTYFDNVIKCNIQSAGTIAGCTETGQLQIDADNINSGNQGLGLMAGTIYANRIYLVGGSCSDVGVDQDPCGDDYAANRKDTIYARIDDSNNIIAESGGVWQFASAQMSPVRRRAVSFGYNGYIYSLAGFSGAESLQDLLFAKIDVSTGDIGAWSSSGVVVTPRWDLNAIVSNGYVYAIGGCGAGAAPSGCSDMQEEIQTFQLYNNDSGSPVGYSASTNQFGTDRFGASSAIVDGYLYVAGGCVSASTDCDSVTDSVQYAQIDSNGNLSSAWSAGGNLPSGRAWGELEVAGGTLYYIGGQTNTATDERPEIYWATPSGGTVTWATVGSAFDLPDGRTQHSATSWNNRIYVTGGIAQTGGAVSNVVYISPDLSVGGDITAAWSTSNSFDIARSGHSLVAYANNLYLLGGYDGTNYLSDTQFASIGYKTGTISQSGTTLSGSGTSWTSGQVGSSILYEDGSTALITGYNSSTSLTVDINRTIPGGSRYTIQDGSIADWSYSTSLSSPIRQGDAFASNGYMYLIGGRSSDNNCASNTLVAPISANTTIASGNNPTGVGEWYETNQRYDGPRYGNSVAYSNGRVYVTGGVCNGFPLAVSVNSNDFSSATTSHNVIMPATVNNGDLLMVLFTNDMAAGGTTTTPSGWTSISTQTSGNTVRGTIFAKLADGTEDGASVDFVTSANEEAASQVYRIPSGEWSGNLAGVEAANVASGTTTTPNPPSLNPGAWGTENTLWLSYIAGSSYSSLTTLPTNHQGGKHNLSNTGTGGASVTSTWRTSAAASEDPAAPTMGSSNEGIAFTIAIRPAGFAKTGNNRTVQTAVYSQPQIAKYSRMIDTDTDVFPTSWLMNGIDNSIGARWMVKYRSMHDLDSTVNPNEDCGTSATMPQMTTWGQEFDYGNVTLGDVAAYTARASGGGNINCARYYYFDVSIDASKTFGYPEDVQRGPTIADLSLFFTSDPSKRLKHGKTFTGGEQQPLDTPCRQSVDANCPLP